MSTNPSAPEPTTARRGRAGALGWIVVVAALALASVWPLLQVALDRFSAPALVLAEAFAPGDPTVTFDHAEFDALLRTHVDPQGFVDYGRLYDDPGTLDHYLTRLATADLSRLGRDEVLALLLNAHNACTLRLVVDHWPLASVGALSADDDFTTRRWMVGGQVLSLAELERDWLRARFVEPRVHFAIAHATMTSAPLRTEAFVGARLDAQLADQMRRVNSAPRWFEFDTEHGSLRLSPIYLAAATDCQQAAGTLLAFVRRWAPELDAWCATHGTPRVTWLEPDLRINGIENRPG